MHRHLEGLAVRSTVSASLSCELRGPLTPTPTSASCLQVSFLEKKVTELENDSLTNGDLKSKLKQENTQLVHRLGLGGLARRGWGGSWGRAWL